MSNLGSTKIFVDKAQWNSRTSRQKGRSSEALAVNASLDAISTSPHSLYHKYQDDQTISLDKLRSAYLGQIQEFSTFLPVFDKFIDDIRQRVGHTISKESLQKYSVLRKHFFEFLVHRYKRKDIGLMEFTPASSRTSSCTSRQWPHMPTIPLSRRRRPRRPSLSMPSSGAIFSKILFAITTSTSPL